MKKFTNLVLLFLMIMILSGCGQGAGSSSASNATSSNSVVSIDAAAVVPVVNGVSTQSQIYVRNNGNVAINDII